MQSNEVLSWTELPHASSLPCWLILSILVAASAGCFEPKIPDAKAESSAGSDGAAQKDDENTGTSVQGDAQVKKATNGPASDEKTKEALFADWDKPKLVLTFSGRQHGYIEPCGCTGLANQKGGLARRHTFLEHMRKDRGWDVLPLDVGNQIRRFGRQAEIKFQVTADVFAKLGYGAVGFGQDDLQLSIGELGAVAIDDGDGSLFSSANVAILHRDYTPIQQVVEIAGIKVGVIAFLGDNELKRVEADEIVHMPEIEGVQLAAANLKEKGVDFNVLLAYSDMEETRAVLDAVPDFELVVTALGAQAPAYEAEKLKGGGLSIQIGEKGMYMPTFGYYPGRSGADRWQYERIPLDDRFEDSPEMLDTLAGYQNLLKGLGLKGLEVRAIKHTSGRTFRGSAKCGECHEAEYEKWLDTAHANATQSLVTPGERTEIPRHFDPECLSCHVTGWNPQKYFPYESGYLGLEATPLMLGSGCENCHGPGSAHIGAEEESDDVDLLNRLRAEMKLALDVAEKSCMVCHDLDNSPDFHDPGAFMEFWEEIEH